MDADNRPTVDELLKQLLELQEESARSGVHIRQLEAQAVIDRAGLISGLTQADMDQAHIAELEAQGVLDRSQIVNLGLALQSARRIGAAVGIVMFAHKVTEEQAFTALRIASQHTHRKLRDIADEVLLTGLPPSGRTDPPVVHG